MSRSRRQPHDHRVGARGEGEAGAAVLTVSTRAAAGEAEDTTGPTIVERLRAWGFRVVATRIVGDEPRAISAALREWIAEAEIRLVLTTGGTGLAPTDVTPEATRDLLEKPAPGIAEHLRRRGVASTELAVLSRGVAGVASGTLIVNLPGSRGGVADGLDTLEPIVVHAVEIASGR